MRLFIGSSCWSGVRERHLGGGRGEPRAWTRSGRALAGPAPARDALHGRRAHAHAVSHSQLHHLPVQVPRVQARHSPLARSRR